MIDEEKNEKNVRDTFKFKTETMDESMDRRFGETTSWTKFSKYCDYNLDEILFLVQEELSNRGIVCMQRQK